MLTFKQFIQEGINDAGIFKAIFVIGVPGAGKSYTITQLAGPITPKVITTDRATEFLGKKFKKAVSQGNWPQFVDSAHRITASTLENYLDGALPLFIDGTSNNLSNISNRIGILKSLGYDVGIVYVKASLKTALARAEARAKKINRHVDPSFIESVFRISDENADFLKGEVSFFRQINNDSDNLDDVVLNKAYKAVQSFFKGEIFNPVGRRLKQEMMDEGLKTISQTSTLSREILKKKINGWYRT